MKRILNYITVSVLLLSSCSFLEEENTSYPTADYYDSAQKIKTGLNGCYDPLRSIYGAGMFQLTECASDIIYLSSYTRPDANCVISPANPCHGRTVWKQGYLGVMRTNEMCHVIDNALEKGFIKEDEYRLLYGEASVMRAMYYYCLTSVFGDVPFYLEPVTEDNRADIAHLGRTSANEIRNELLDELMYILLPSDKGGHGYMPLVRSYDTGTEYRGGAALGLMLAGKFALWNERWDDAVTVLSVLEDIYDPSGKYLENPEQFGVDYPLTDIPFQNKWTKESIFETSNKVEDYGQQEYYTLASYCTPSRSSVEISDDEDETDASMTVVSNNYNGILIPEMSAHARTYKAARPTYYFYGRLMTYNSSDLRSGVYTGSDTPRASSGNLAWRWKGVDADTPDGEEKVMWFNSCTKPTSQPWLGNKFWCPTIYYNRDSNNPKIFRYAGALLNLAEAHLMSGNVDMACRYLSIVKVRAGLNPYSSGDIDSVMENIREECARELFGEFQRKFDLVRWGIWYERTYQAHAETSGSGYLTDFIKPFHKYYPIPDDQVSYSGGALNNNDYLQ